MTQKNDLSEYHAQRLARWAEIGKPQQPADEAPTYGLVDIPPAAEPPQTEYYFYRPEEAELLAKLAIERAALFARSNLREGIPDADRRLLRCITAAQTALEVTEARRSWNGIYPTK